MNRDKQWPPRYGKKKGTPTNIWPFWTSSFILSYFGIFSCFFQKVCSSRNPLVFLLESVKNECPTTQNKHAKINFQKGSKSDVFHFCKINILKGARLKDFFEKNTSSIALLYWQEVAQKQNCWKHKEQICFNSVKNCWKAVIFSKLGVTEACLP